MPTRRDPRRRPPCRVCGFVCYCLLVVVCFIAILLNLSIYLLQIREVHGGSCFAPPTPGRFPDAPARLEFCKSFDRHRLNGYLDQWAPNLFPASSSSLDCAVLESMLSWRARYPLSQVPMKPVPIRAVGRRKSAFEPPSIPRRLEPFHHLAPRRARSFELF